MSPSGGRPVATPLELLPHQAALLETFFNPAGTRVILLLGAVGLGKSVALIALAARLLRERTAARALFLVPAGLVSQFAARLTAWNVPTLQVDRYRFRELLDAENDAEIWPSGVAAVLSRDLAKQPDVRESLTHAHWDLVAADEAHGLRGARAVAFTQIAGKAERVVLATANQESDYGGLLRHAGELRLDAELPLPFASAHDTTLVEWRRDQVVDQRGRLLDTLPHPSLHEVHFGVSQSELALADTVTTLCRSLHAGSAQQRFVAQVLLDTLHSSPAALEASLRRLSERFQLQAEEDELFADLEEEETEEPPVPAPVRQQTTEITSEIAGRALEQIEAIDLDSKLDAFGGLLSRLLDGSIPRRRLCVITTRLATLYYLATYIEGRGLECWLLHGGMTVEERQRALAMSSSGGGVLVASTAVPAGVAPPEVSDLVLYDLPRGARALQRILGQFNRFNRSKPLDVHVLVPSGGAHGFADGSLESLREILGSWT